MVSESPNGAAEPTKDVELSNSDKNQQEEHDSLDKVHKEERTLPDFFPSHGLTTAGKLGLQGSRNARKPDSALAIADPSVASRVASCADAFQTHRP